MWRRTLSHDLQDGQLRTELKRLLPAMPAAAAWSDVQERAQGGLAAATPSNEAMGRALEGRLVGRNRRHRSASAKAAIAFVAVLLLACAGTAAFEAATHLGKGRSVLVIGDDTLGATAATGRTVQTAPLAGGTWQKLPLHVEGGSVTALVIDPTDSEVLYATTNEGTYKSTDRAATWKAVPVEQSAKMMVVDPDTPSTVYRVAEGSLAGAGGALYKSVDGGATWTRISTEENTFTRILVDPSTSHSTLYGIRPWGYPEYSRLCKSTDGGSTWQDLTDSLRAAPNGTAGSLAGSLASLDIDPAGHLLYAAGVGGAGGSGSSWLLRSSDGGATWEDATEQVPGEPPIMDPRDSSRLYSYRVDDSGTAATFVSTDGARTWSELTGAELAWATTVVAANNFVAPGTAAALIEAVANFLRDFSGTVSDAPTGSQAGISGKVLIDRSDPSVLYAPTERGVYKSVDAGATWHQSSKGMTDTSVSAVAVDSATPSTVYATTSAGMVKSADGGASWAVVGIMPGGTPGHVSGGNELLVAPSSPSTLYAQTGDGLFRSDNGGTTWAKREGTTFGQFSGLLLVASNAPGTVYANGWGDPNGLDVEGLFRSTDGGLTWSKVDGLPEGRPGVRDNPPRGAGILVEAPSDPGTLYASARTYAPDGAQGPFRLFNSIDGGQTWAPLGDHSWTGDVTSLVVAPGDPSTILATVGVGFEDSGLWRSTDGGYTWTHVKTDWGSAGGNWGPLLLSDPRNGDLVYAVSDVRGLYRSTDGGATWMDAGDWSPGEVDEWGSAVLDPAEGALYVATPEGLFKWTPGGS